MGKIKQLIDQTKRSNFWKGVIVLVSGTLIAKLIGLLTTPIVSRLYTPQDFGEYAIITSVAIIIQSFVTLGLNSAIMVAETEEDSKDVFMVTFIIIISLSSLIFFGMIFLSSVIHFFD